MEGETIMEWKTDTRPKRGLWAPGDYMGKCSKCLDGFIGDKRALMCADCAYAEPEKSATPMTLTPEEALREALEPWPMAALDADRVISRLEPRGYRLTPIEINEAAVEKAAEALETDIRNRPSMVAFSSVDMARAAIVAYLEGAK